MSVLHNGAPVSVIPVLGDRAVIGNPNRSKAGSAPDIPVQDREVEARHAVLERTEQGYAVTLLVPSRNATLDGAPLTQGRPEPLRSGSRMELGRYGYALEVVFEGEGPRRDHREIVRRVGSPEVYPPAGRSRYLDYLPGLYRDQDFMGRFLQIFEVLWEPHERRQDHIEAYLDPRTAPAALLPWMERWYALPLPAELDEVRRRLLLAHAVELHRRRGTASGLKLLVDLATGQPCVVSEDPKRPFVVRVTCPAGVHRPVVEELVRRWRPAHVAFEVEVQA